MVRDGQLRLIDVFFVQVRPSPWRQAVDLANMMLVLALRTDAERVYEHALHYFTPDEIAEAFAAARGVASPTQLRSHAEAGRPRPADRVPRLAPAREPVSIQRWSVRRVVLTIAVAVGRLPRRRDARQQLDRVRMTWPRRAGAVLAIALLGSALTGLQQRGGRRVGGQLPGRGGRAVRAPGAVRAVGHPAPLHRGAARRLDLRRLRRPRAGPHGSGSTRTAAASTPSRSRSRRRVRSPARWTSRTPRRGRASASTCTSSPSIRSRRTGTSCSRADASPTGIRLGGDAEPTLALEADEAVTFGLRTVLVRKIEEEFGLTLCGAGAPPCVGGD